MNRPSLHTLTAHFIRLGIAFALLWGLRLWDNGVLMLHEIGIGLKASTCDAHISRFVNFLIVLSSLSECGKEWKG